MPNTVSSDPLPTVQLDGVVWDQVIVGNTVYVGGEFTTARPAGHRAGDQPVTRNNFLAYNLTTGDLITSFAPSFNAQVRTVAASPDGSTLYVGGQFTQLDGVNRYRLVAFDLATGTVKDSFAAVLSSSVYGLDAAKHQRVYATGIFTSANNLPRAGVVAFNAGQRRGAALRRDAGRRHGARGHRLAGRDQGRDRRRLHHA